MYIYQNRPFNEDKYVSIVDDDSIFHNEFSPILPPPNVKSFAGHAITFDCTHGLVCSYRDPPFIMDGKDAVVLWNPSIRKSVEIVLPHRSKSNVVGVGVCPRTSDPKIVMVPADWKPEVFTLSTGAWRSISMNLRRHLKPFTFNPCQVVVDGVIHWAVNDCHWEDTMIISFDLTNEEFGEVALPDSLLQPDYRFIYKLKEPLALIDHRDGDNLNDVWMMIKNGDPKSPFTKLYTIHFETLDNSRFYNTTIGFRNNGQPIVEEPCSKQIKDLEIDTTYDLRLRRVTSYTESLLLLNNCTSITY